MSQTGYTPIQLYYSTTAAAAPTAGNLASGELAINITDGKLFYKDNAGVVQTLATKATALSTVTNNGVVYVNSSGQATSGSALTFDGTTLTSQAGVTSVVGAAGKYTIAYTTANIASRSWRIANDLNVYGDFAIQQSTTQTGSTFRDVYTALNDGTSYWSVGGSEQMRLTSTGLGIGTSSPLVKLVVSNSGLNGYEFDPANGFISSYNRNTSAWTAVKFRAGSYIWNLNNSNDALNLDTSGNLGLGVTPSAGNTLTFFQVKNAQFGGYSNYSYVNANTYYNSGWYYIASDLASRYEQSSGSHKWYNAPSGTAGTGIAFTQAMTLDASGRLLLGQTSNADGFKFEMAGSGGTAGDLGMDTNATYCEIQSFNSKKLYLNRQGNDVVIAATAGHLLVGTTSTVNSAIETVSFLSSSGGTGISLIDSQANNTASFAAFYSNATKIGSITNNGNAAVLYNVTSDQRLKENIVDAPEFGSVIDSIQVRSYDWKTNQTHQRAGFVAQELVTVAPEAVHQPADPEEMMAVDYSKLVPMLVKEIQSLRKRLATLESK